MNEPLNSILKEIAATIREKIEPEKPATWNMDHIRNKAYERAAKIVEGYIGP